MKAPALVGWFAVGVLLMLGLTALAFVVLPVVLLAGWFTARAVGWRPFGAALVGAAWLPAYAAFENRDGPGWSCSTSYNSQECVSLGSPWPMLTAALALLVIGTLWLWLSGGGSPRHLRHR